VPKPAWINAKGIQPVVWNLAVKHLQRAVVADIGAEPTPWTQCLCQGRHFRELGVGCQIDKGRAQPRIEISFQVSCRSSDRPRNAPSLLASATAGQGTRK
jgi:hypothetical protein